MATKSSELATIIKDLEEQGCEARPNRKGGYLIKFPDGTVDTFSASKDPKAVRSQRAVVRRHGLHWPLDPLPKERKPHPNPLAQAIREANERLDEKYGTEQPMVARTAQPTLDVGVKEVMVDPDLAARWLERNKLNRKLLDGVVGKYAKAMEEGRWHYDAAPIRFDTAGNLLDGQHRLWAIIESGTTQKFLVVEGLDPKSFVVMDTGKMRNLADLISIEFPDYKSLSHLSANTGIIFRWEHGGRGRQLHTRNIATNFRQVTNEEMMEFFRANHEEIYEITTEAHRLAQGAGRGIAGSVYALAIWVFSRIDKADMDGFFEAAHTGIGLHKGHPAMTLRNALVRFVASNQGGRTTLPTDVAAAWLFKAWNAYRRGEDMHAMTYRPGGANPEKFPIPE